MDETTTPPTPEKQTKNTTKIVQKELWFDLTEQDFANKARRLAELAGILAGAEAELDAAKGKFKASESAIDMERGSLIKAVQQKKEQRNVECELVHDYARATVYYVYQGSIFEQRPMEPGERQQSLALAAEPAKKTKKITNEKAAEIEAKKAAAEGNGNLLTLGEKKPAEDVPPLSDQVKEAFDEAGKIR